MSRFKAAIFDLDGTLAYTMDDLGDSMNEMLGICGYPRISKQRLLMNINGGAINFVRRSMPPEYQADDGRLEEAYLIYNGIYALHYADKTHLYDGMQELLDRLKGAGFKLGVLSNKQHLQTCAIIDGLVKKGTFDLVIGQSKFPHKPDSTAPLYIADSFGVKAGEMAFVGDSDVDMKTAINAGMTPLGVTWGYRGEDVLLSNGAKYIAHDPKAAGDIILA